MTRHYKEWTIEVTQVDHWDFGRGFHATAFIGMTDGTKGYVREFYRYEGIKTQKEMIEYTQKLLEV